MVITGAKGAAMLEAPMETKLAGLAHIKREGQADAMHKLIGGIHRQAQMRQMDAADASAHTNKAGS